VRLLDKNFIYLKNFKSTKLIKIKKIVVESDSAFKSILAQINHKIIHKKLILINEKPNNISLTKEYK